MLFCATVCIIAAEAKWPLNCLGPWHSLKTITHFTFHNNITQQGSPMTAYLCAVLNKNEQAGFKAS